MDYQYTLYYDCAGCNGQIAHTMMSSDPNISTVSAKQTAAQGEAWCEDCDWHGPIGLLSYVRMTIGSWLSC